MVAESTRSVYACCSASMFGGVVLVLRVGTNTAAGTINAVLASHTAVL